MDNRGMTWHGLQPYQPEWTDETRLVAFTVSSPIAGGLYCAFNTSHRPVTVDLPHWPGLTWQPVADTGKVGLASVRVDSTDVVALVIHMICALVAEGLGPLLGCLLVWGKQHWHQEQ